MVRFVTSSMSQAVRFEGGERSGTLNSLQFQLDGK
jgi:hypothetical protein